MKTKDLIKISIGVTLLFCICPQSYSWWAITHYSIGRELGYTHEQSGNMNLPDAWPTGTVGVEDWFCWSHAVQRTGRTSGIPNVPRKLVDGREPGSVILQLVDKIEWKDDAEKQKAIRTAIGFSGHNGADNVVHWDYFLGGIAAFPEYLNNWITNHKTKEEWADYCIWIRFGNGSFNENGVAKTLWEFEIGNNSQNLIPISANPKIIQIAQKAARKNRRKMDYENGLEANSWKRIDSLSKINSRISDYNAEMTNYIKTMNLRRFDELQLKAVNKKNNWTMPVLVQMYNDSRVRASNWIHGHAE